MRNRRTLLVTIAGALIPVVATTLRGVHAAAETARSLLSPTEPAAVAIAYVENASRVDAKAYPAYRRGQSCTTCAYVELGTGRARGCSVVPGRLVLATGWCKVWKPRGNG